MTEAVLRLKQNCEQKYIGETKRKLADRVKEHKEEVEKITRSRAYTRVSRQQLEVDRWKSVIAGHAISSNHIIDWESVKVMTEEGDF